MSLYRNNESSGGPALRIGPLHKINVSSNELSRRFERLLNPPPRY